MTKNSGFWQFPPEKLFFPEEYSTAQGRVAPERFDHISVNMITMIIGWAEIIQMGINLILVF